MSFAIENWFYLIIAVLIYPFSVYVLFPFLRSTIKDVCTVIVYVGRDDFVVRWMDEVKMLKLEINILRGNQERTMKLVSSKPPFGMF